MNDNDYTNSNNNNNNNNNNTGFNSTANLINSKINHYIFNKININAGVSTALKTGTYILQSFF